MVQPDRPLSSKLFVEFLNLRGSSGLNEFAAASVQMARLWLTRPLPLRRSHELQHDLIAVFQWEAETIPIAFGIRQFRFRRQRNEQALPENRMRQEIPLGAALAVRAGGM